MWSHAARDLAGRVVGGRYRLLRSIGEGGMGLVFEAEQTDLRRRVAVKVLLDTDPKSIERFMQEARATANLNCPNVVTVVDFRSGSRDEPPILVMELLEGEPLSTVLDRDHRLPVSRAAGIALQMLNGLAAAHRAGVIHRDIKPSNVFLVPSVFGDAVKLVDFGIAKVLVGEGGVKTTTGVFPGTPAYVAPEQLRMEEADARTDIHGVGVVLFEMLAGRRPWEQPGIAELSAAILREAPPPLATLRPDAPKELAAIVARALSKNRIDRFKSADEMMSALRPFVAAAPPKDQPGGAAVPVLPRIVTAPLSGRHDAPTRPANLAAPGAPPMMAPPAAMMAPPATPRNAADLRRITVVVIVTSCLLALVGIVLIVLAVRR